MEIFIETIDVVETLIAYGEGYNSVHEEVICLDTEKRGSNQRDTVSKSERGDKFKHVLELRQEEHNAKQEQKMIVPGKHVHGAQGEEIEESTLRRSDLVLLGHAVAECDSAAA